MEKGIDGIPLRIPSQWNPRWFADFVRDVLARGDVRNAIQGPGITITGQPDEQATISASVDVSNLLIQPFVLTSPSGYLETERVLGGNNGITITDNGPNSTVAVGIADGGIHPSKLNSIPPLSVLGNQGDADGYPSAIAGSSNGDVLRIRDLGSSELEVEFSPIAADPSTQIGLSPVNGTSIYAMRADAAPALDQSISPTWTGNHTWSNPLTVPGLDVIEGSDARMGLASLVAGEAIVNTEAVTANSRIFLTHQNNDGTPGFVSVTARVAGTSFTITSSSATDTSDIAWLIVEPSA